MLVADTITKREFEATLLRYKPLLQAISNVKSASSKEDDETLEDLDWFRFVTAPNKYMKREGDENDLPLERDDVVRLVKWKLKHGKFRPNLLKLASSNPAATVTSTSLAAFAMCPDPFPHESSNHNNHGTPNASALSALRTLTLLTGIGPATSSLLLSVHAPDTVVFFSDEVFRWLCRGGKESPIKYNWKEYAELEEKAREFMRRLDIGARDLERAAWVIMRGGTEPSQRETAQDVQQERTEKSQRHSKEESRPSLDTLKIHGGSESPPDEPLRKAQTVPARMPSNAKSKSNDSIEPVPTISSGAGSLDKQAQEEAAIEGARVAAQKAQLEAAKAQIRAKSPPIPVHRHHLRMPKSPSLRASERTLMAISKQRIIPEDKIIKAFEANARKPRPKSSRTAAEERKRLAAQNMRAAGPSLDIPDAKTLARKASARLLEQQEQHGPGSERQKSDDGVEKKLEAVVEDLRSAGAKISRVISPPPLRHRRGNSRKSNDDNRISQALSLKTQNGAEAEKGSQKLSENKSESPKDRTEPPARVTTPVLRQRDGSKFTEAFSPPLEQGDSAPVPTGRSKTRAAAPATKRSSSEQKGRSPEPQTVPGKRPRRVGTRAGLKISRSGPADDAATIASVDCSGCFNLGRSNAGK